MALFGDGVSTSRISPGGLALGTPTRMTIHAWVKYSRAPDTTQNQAIIATTVPVQSDWGIIWDNTSSAFSSSYYQYIGSGYVQAKAAFSTTQWNAVTAGYDGTQVFIVANGKRANTANTVDPSVSGSPVCGIFNDASSNSNAFPGTIGRITLWYAALAAWEIAQLQQGRDPRLIRPGTPAFDYGLNGAGQLYDFNGNRRPATATGTFRVANPPPIKPIPSKLITYPDWLLVASGSPFIPYLELVARAPIPNVSLLSHLEGVKLELRSQDSFFGLAGNPLRDWPVPLGPKYASDLRGFFNPLELLLQSKDGFFGLAGNPTTDWPVPKSAQGGISLKTWVDPLKTELNGQDRFFGLGGAPQFNWPNPSGPRSAIDLKTSADPLKLLFAVQFPFVWQDWPNPQGVRYPNDLKNFVSALDLSLLGKDQFFGLAGNPQRDWPNPITSKSAIDLKTSIDPLKLLLSVQFPFVWQDWPAPRGSLAAISLRTWTDQLKLELIGQDQFFGLAGQPMLDWPVPKVAASSVSLRTWTNELRLNLQVQFPFFWQDWALPQGLRYPTELRTWLDPLKLNLRGKDVFFGLGGAPNFDWPVPKGVQVGVALKFWSSPLSLNLNVLTFPLFGLVGSPSPDWPVPPAAARSIVLRTWLEQLKTLLQGGDNFFGLGGNPFHDWPVPKVKEPGIALRTWTLNPIYITVTPAILALGEIIDIIPDLRTINILPDLRTISELPY